MSTRFYFSLCMVFIVLSHLSPSFADLDRIPNYWSTIPEPNKSSSTKTKFERSFGDNEYAYVSCPQVNSLCYFIAEDGTQISAQIFQELKPYNSIGFAAAKVNGKWGYIDRAGDWILKPEFEAVDEYSREGVVSIKQNNLWGALNANGQMFFKPKIGA